MRSSARFARRFAVASRGNVAMMFALLLPIVLMLTLGGVDISRATTVRGQLQDALDAAALAAARSSYVTNAELTEVGLQALRANMPDYFNDTAGGTATFTLTPEGVVIADASVDVQTLVANVILPPYGQLLDDTLPVGTHSEVNRSSRNLEVALVLDITGSMGCNKKPSEQCPASSRIEALKAAALQLVTIVVQDVQTPFFTRMSIVPYSTGVNLRDYADAARGTPTGGTAITNIAWAVNAGKAITAISKANPGVVQAAGHGLTTGDIVFISGVAGMTQINDKLYQVVSTGANTFTLKTTAGAVVNTSGSGYSTYVGNGLVRKCQVTSCNLVVTSSNHGLAATDPATNATAMVRLSDIGGITALNGKVFDLQRIDANKFSIPVYGPTAATYTSGGKAWCGSDGCQWRLYRNSSNAVRSFQISACATERVVAEKTSDASPTTAYVGRMYPNPDASNAPCPIADNGILPLTSSKADLNKLIGDLQPNGYTAGQIGLAWGWYTVSPNFNGLWTGHPANVYKPQETLKAVILMTDGEFNANYCSGVLAKNAGYSSSSDRVNCNATNGDPFTQAAALCVKMKQKGIIIYTVGFQIASSGNAATILRNCATSTDHAFLPANGDDLSDDFAAIGRDITRLRISR